MQTAEQMIRQSLIEIQRELKQEQQKQIRAMLSDFQTQKEVLETLPAALASLSKQHDQQLSRYKTIADVEKRMTAIEQRQMNIEKDLMQNSKNQDILIKKLDDLSNTLISQAQSIHKLL